MLSKKNIIFFIILIIAGFSAWSYADATTNSNTANFGKIYCNGCGSGNNVRATQTYNPYNFQAYAAEFGGSYDGYGGFGPSGGKYGIDACINSTGSMWSGSCWNMVDANGAGNVGNGSGNVPNPYREISSGDTSPYNWAVASYYVNDAEITPYITVYGREVSIDGFNSTEYNTGVNVDFDVTWSANETTDPVELQYSGPVSCDVPSPAYLADNWGTTCHGTGAGTGNFELFATGYGAGGKKTISDTLSVNFSNTMVPLNFVVRNQSNQYISNALVTINQNFGNGTTRNTDNVGFASFGANKNVNVGYSVSATDCTTVNGSQNTGNSGATVNVSMNCTGGTNPGSSNQDAVGIVESVSCSAITGVAVDPDNWGQSVRVYLFKDYNAYGNPRGTPPFGTYVTDVLSNIFVDRSAQYGGNAVGNYGFSIPIPDTLKDGVNHTLYIHALDLNGTGPNNAIAGSGFNINCSPSSVPTLGSPTATAITSTSATLGATITSGGNPSTITARGTCWGTSAGSITNCSNEGGITTGVFSHSRTGMPSNTTIYYYGYASNSYGTGYSSVATFNTLSAGAISLTATTPVYPGDPITVTFTNVPSPTVRDWIGFYVLGNTGNSFLAGSEGWKYEGASPCGQTVPASSRSSGSCTFTAPATPGNYNFRLWDNDNILVQHAVSNTVVVSAVPTISASPSSVAAGGTITVTFANVPTPTIRDWIGMYVLGNTGANFLSGSEGWKYEGASPCTQTVPGTSRSSGTCTFTAPSTPGSYNFRLWDNDNILVQHAVSNTITVTSAPTLSASPSTVTAGNPITVTFANVPSPTIRDWIGMYVLGNTGTSFLDWKYEGVSPCTQTVPGASRASGSCTFTAPASAGSYNFRLWDNDNILVQHAVSNTVTVNSAAPTTWNLSVAKNISIGGTVTSSLGPVNCGSTCSGTYSDGAFTILTATPRSSYWKFTGWSGGTGACSGTSFTCSIIMNADKSTQANFAPRLFLYREF